MVQYLPVWISPLSIFLLCYIDTIVSNICSQLQLYRMFILLVRGIKVRRVLRVRRFAAVEPNGSKNLLSINETECSKPLEMLILAYGEYSLSQKIVYKRYKLFKELNKMWMTTFVLDSPKQQQPIKMLMKWRKLLRGIIKGSC